MESCKHRPYAYDSKKTTFEGIAFFLDEPLSADVEYTLHETVVASDSFNSGHGRNSEKSLIFSCKNLKFPMAYTKLCNSVDSFLRNCVRKSRLWHLKG